MLSRLAVFRKIAQTLPAAAVAPAPVATAPVAQIDIRSIPKFNANLFAQKPAMIQDLGQIINKMNSYMSSLTGGKVLFSSAWLAPSVSASQYPSAAQYLLTIAKWLYTALTLQAQPYSLIGLNKLATDFTNTVNSYPFSDPGASEIKSSLLSLGTIMTGKLSK